MVLKTLKIRDPYTFASIILLLDHLSQKSEGRFLMEAIYQKHIFPWMVSINIRYKKKSTLEEVKQIL